ncbi:hypothetical protein BC939DRAFT_479918 [Gamsiella multidivaricata]|uniref:uncharacterized protein n=1 Tax=Gamsiella multidivaricata TaxID=101098 RepID=UPI00221FFF57|nr:uncharacterized protein BC939DRAFT_479918 [Gamsiella multidivaricata]KAI7818974.1 hypothetical protein BC939DRAFT_479918 [Gamsiella multidivaricata]
MTLLFKCFTMLAVAIADAPVLLTRRFRSFAKGMNFSSIPCSRLSSGVPTYVAARFAVCLVVLIRANSCTTLFLDSPAKTNFSRHQELGSRVGPAAMNTWPL